MELDQVMLERIVSSLGKLVTANTHEERTAAAREIHTSALDFGEQMLDQLNKDQLQEARISALDLLAATPEDETALLDRTKRMISRIDGLLMLP